MRPWKVRDVMTSEVLTVDYDTALAEVVNTLTAYDVSAVAVVDEYDSVLGVVTRTDVLSSLRIRSASPAPRLPWRRPALTPTWTAHSAGQMMSAPAMTVEPDATLAEAGRLMRRRSVDRLLVVGHDRRLLGIVSAADLLKPHHRPDDEIRAGARRALASLPADDLAFTVHDGVVTLAGTVDDDRTAKLLPPLIRDVPGVTAIRNEVTVAAPPARSAGSSVPRPHPPADDWWPTRHPHREARPTAALAA